MSYQFELALPTIFAAFDGTNDISEEDFQSRFDNLYHKNYYTFEPINKTTMTRDDMLELYILYILCNICIFTFIFIILGTFL
jgi:hypothetical protein